jgi:glutamate synthase (ferredoxin)
MPWEWCSCPKVPTKSFCKTTFEASIKDQKLEGWRTVPVDASNLGQIAAEKEPQ